MNSQDLKPQVADGDIVSRHDTAPNPLSGGTLSTYLSNLNKMRDIYIDSNLFRNPAWEVFLSLYSKCQARLPVTLATLSAGNRLTNADCAEAVENLVKADLAWLVESQSDTGPKTIELTEKGQQRMEAFLRSAERT